MIERDVLAGLRAERRHPDVIRAAEQAFNAELAKLSRER